MFPGSTAYNEGQFRPEEGIGPNWHVWCATGALEVIEKREYERWLSENPDTPYTINFANNSAAHITTVHPLWLELAEVATSYTVEVYPLNFSKKYVPWTGQPEDLGNFDAIQISRKG